MSFWEDSELAERQRAEQMRMDILIAMGDLPVRNAETLATAAYKVLCEYAAAEGQTPEIECSLVKPGQPFGDGSGDRWMACWEAGPYMWGIETSMAVTIGHGLCEPHWGFDLCFYPAEDYG